MREPVTCDDTLVETSTHEAVATSCNDISDADDELYRRQWKYVESSVMFQC